MQSLFCYYWKRQKPSHQTVKPSVVKSDKECVIVYVISFSIRYTTFELLFLIPQDVSGLKCGGVLFSGQVLPSECLSGLVEVAGDPNTSHALTGSIISLLAQFGTKPFNVVPKSVYSHITRYLTIHVHLLMAQQLLMVRLKRLFTAATTSPAL